MRAFIIFPLLFALGCQSGGLLNPKEGERSALRPFRSTPFRLDATPQTVGKKTNEEQLVLVTVYDEDGHALGRRRIEWTLEGPGQIAAVDDGGIFVRGKKDTDGKSAVSATHSSEKTIGRKTKNKADDFTVKAGQSWCIVTSAVEGQTVLTATCPDVTDRAKGRTITKILWANSEFTFPAAATTRVGGDLTLATSVNQLSTSAAPGTLRVRYRILGGAPASLIADSSTASLSGTNPQEAVANTDTSGSAGVRILQPSPVPGRTKVGIEIFKADPNGIGAGQLVARSETFVEWSSAKLTLDCMANATGAIGREFTYKIVVANTATVESPAVVIRAPIPEGVELVTTDPAPSVRNGRELSFSVGPLAGNAKREYSITVKPLQQGVVTFRTAADTADGQRAETSAKATISTAGIKVALETLAVIGTNENAIARVLIRNIGGVPADNVTVWVNGGVIPANSPGEYTVGTIAPGATRTVEVPIKATASGRFALRANVTADGGLTDKAETSLDVKKAGITMDVRGPAKMATGEEATYEIGLVNAGEEELSNIRISTELPTGMRVVNSGRETSAFTTTVASLAPNGRKVIPFTVVADSPQDGARLIAKATATPSPNRTLESMATATVSANATPVLALELSSPQRPVPIESVGRYRVVIRNKGTNSSSGIVATVEFPEELIPIKASEGVRIDGRNATYTLTRELRANESVTIYVEAKANMKGTATIRATVQAPLLVSPLKEEQATRVVGSGG